MNILDENMYAMVYASELNRRFDHFHGALIIDRTIKVLENHMPEYGYPGSRDVEVTSKRNDFARMISHLQDIDTVTTYF